MLFIQFILVIVSGCGASLESKLEVNTLFTLLNSDSTHVNFTNYLDENEYNNVLNYEYFYNGAGVAVGDLNGDDFDDIYFVGNIVDNQLYLNQKNLEFNNVTAIAGVKGRPLSWGTGVTFADVNGDRKKDIFVSYSAKTTGDRRSGELFINQGNNEQGIPIFKESAKSYGLADSCYATQTYFFDYDLDGDLDAFFLNHSPETVKSIDEQIIAAKMKQNDWERGLRLFQNRDNYFTEVTKQSGILNTVITYGLSACIGDINLDGWPDIYVANDYRIPDYLYINNRDGTFTDNIRSMMGHFSKSSMGSDISDINNDGYPDIVVLDMLPEDNRRQKLLFASENYESFDLTIRSGLYYQYMRNMLHLNNGNGTFSEIGQFSGISNTDWSWAPVVADFNNDGWKDLFVTNGFFRDYTNMDFLKYMGDYLNTKGRLEGHDLLQLVQSMPSSNVSNYMFENNQNLAFNDVGNLWGLEIPSNSNGAAYSDLDKDGDLDLIINNINHEAFIYRNESTKINRNHYLQVKLNGMTNSDGVGAKVMLYVTGQQQVIEQMPARGYQSTVTDIIHFGLGKVSKVDSLKVTWLSGKSETKYDLSADQQVAFFESNAAKTWKKETERPPIYQMIEPPIKHQDVATNFVDFKRQPLMVNPISYDSPCIAKGDINADGLEDIYIGGSYNTVGKVFLQKEDQSYVEIPQPMFVEDRGSTDSDALFIDINNDQLLDLYVASGGYHDYRSDDPRLKDRVYINNGKAIFDKQKDALPDLRSSSSCVRATDLNNDGFSDFYIGGRVIPGKYPEPPDSYILINDGKGNFKDKTDQYGGQIRSLGMVTDAEWIDINQDGHFDLIVVGEWMNIKVMINNDGQFVDQSAEYFTGQTFGWWNDLLISDLNADGKYDLVIGNSGSNMQFMASESKPAELYYKDFDSNGSIDPILCHYVQGESYPVPSRDELLEQLSPMRSKFPNYASYADAQIGDVFSKSILESAELLYATNLETSYFEMGNDGRFHSKPLPIEVQFAPVYTINEIDYNQDGIKDLLMCGNEYEAKLRVGRRDANYGMLLKGLGNGKFEYIPQRHSGFKLTGDVRSVAQLNDMLLFGINQNKICAYSPTL